MKKFVVMLSVSCLMMLGLSGCSSEGVGSFVERSQRCSDDKVQQWIDGKWIDIQRCIAPEKCKLLSVGAYGCVATQESGGVEEPVKTIVCDFNGQTKCTSARDAMMRCSEDGTELSREPCGEREFCDESQNKCVSTGTVIGDLEDEACESGEVTCVNNALAQCVNNAWTVEKVCGLDETCADGVLLQGCYCNLGAARCDGNRLSVCRDYAWPEVSETLDCGENYVCSEESAECVAKAVCTPGVQACDSEDTFHVCGEDGQWGDTFDCKVLHGVNYKCAQEEGVCYESTSPGVNPGDPEGCAVGTTTCLSATSKGVCDGKTFVKTDCSMVGENFVCVAGECVAATVDPGGDPDECTGGASFCDGNKATICMDGVWAISEDCGDKTCVMENGSASCIKTSSGDTGNACTGTGMKCSGDGYVSCVDGKWSSVQSCGSGMKCANDECITDGSVTDCVPGAKRCVTGTVGGTYQACQSDGTWGKATSCSSITQVCSGGECLACEPGNVKCGSGRDRNYVYTCNADGSAYEKASDRCELGCSDGVCRTCNNNQTQCDGASYQVCSNGVWTEAASCGDASSCIAKSGCDCKAGETKCDDAGNVLKCTEHSTGNWDGSKYKSWDVVSVCGEGLCDDSGSSAVCTCKDGEKRCTGDVLETCAGGIWEQTDCTADNMKCDSGALACVCENDGYYCPTVADMASLVRYRCVEGVWNTKDYLCGTGSTCSSELGSVCVPSQCNELNLDKLSSLVGGDPNAYGSKCEGNNLMSCEGGVYVVKAVCQTGCNELNLAGMALARCGATSSQNSMCWSKDETRCASSTTVEKCAVSGLRLSWQTSDTCDSNEVCGKSENGYACLAKVCDAGSFSCNGTKIQQCSDNALVDLVDCADSGLVCKKGVCVAK